MFKKIGLNILKAELYIISYHFQSSTPYFDEREQGFRSFL